MTEQKTFTFTTEQIRDIFRRGFDYGERYDHDTDGGITDVIHDIVNEGVRWPSDDYVSYDVIKEWFKK